MFLKMRKPLRPDEEWARLIVQRHLGCEVIGYDDGSANGMYDLRIGLSEPPQTAIEVLRVQDTTCTLVWKKGRARGGHWCVDGDWAIDITATAIISNLRDQLESVLNRLNGRGVQHLVMDDRLRHNDPALFNSLKPIGIRSTFRSPGPGSGKVYFTMDGDGEIGEMVNVTGQGLSNWLADYLRDNSRKDNLRKLARSGAKSCHIFLILTLAGTPSALTSYFITSFDPLPSDGPDLPAPLTAVWLMPSWEANGSRGLYWSGSAWHIVEDVSACTRG